MIFLLLNGNLNRYRGARVLDPERPLFISGSAVCSVVTEANYSTNLSFIFKKWI